MVRVGLLWGGVCVLFRYCMTGFFEQMCGGCVWRECAGDGTRFMKFGGAGVCKRTGKVEFRMVPVRYGAQLI